MNSLGLEIFNVYKSVIPSRIEVVNRTVNEVIQSVINIYSNMDNDLLFELKVVLNELILNAIIHGNKEDKAKFVEVNAAITKSNYFLLSISDEGEGYDYNFYLKKCSENKDVLCWNDVEEKGRGIKIVKSLCDNIRFNEKGNKVFVVKSLEKHYITSEWSQKIFW